MDEASTSAPSAAPRTSPSTAPGSQRDGWFNPLGFEQVANFRDVAGSDEGGRSIEVAGGCRVQRRRLFRCAQLSFATPGDIALMRDTFGIKTYIDLRSDEGHFETRDGQVFDVYPPSPVRRPGQTTPERPGECRRISYHLLRGIGVRRLTQEEKKGNMQSQPDTWYQLAMRDPVTKRLYNPKGTKETMNHLKLSLSLNNKAMLKLSGARIAGVLRECTKEANYPLMFGCMTGKDRTGLISCLLLAALGARDDDILHDYMLSQAAVQHNATLVLKNINLLRKEHAELAEGLQGVQGGAADPRNQVMASVFPSIMRDTLRFIREELGGIETYLDSIGFGPDERRELRRLLLEPGSKL